MTPPRPREAAREDIDAALITAGRVVQDLVDLNRAVNTCVAVRDFYSVKGYGREGYVFFLGRPGGLRRCFNGLRGRSDARR